MEGIGRAISDSCKSLVGGRTLGASKKTIPRVPKRFVRYLPLHQRSIQASLVARIQTLASVMKSSYEDVLVFESGGDPQRDIATQDGRRV